MKRIELTAHARTVATERDLDLAWIEATAISHDWGEPDPDRALRRHFGSVANREGRVLRVVCEKSRDTIRVVTAFFDRRARRPA